MSANEKAGWKQRATEQNHRVQLLFPLVSSFLLGSPLGDVGHGLRLYRVVSSPSLADKRRGG